MHNKGCSLTARPAAQSFAVRRDQRTRVSSCCVLQGVGQKLELKVCYVMSLLHLQGASVLGIAMIAMAEPLGAQMAGRALEHLLQYGEPSVRWVSQGLIYTGLVGSDEMLLVVRRQPGNHRL
jgi:hypothetical protein